MRSVTCCIIFIFCRVHIYGQQADCGQTELTDPSGTLSSPNYPRDYPDNVDCQWTITAAPDKVLQISVLEMNIENDYFCSADYVEIYDGTTQVGGFICGTFVPAPFIASSAIVTITFVSDSSVTETGFEIEWLSIDKCAEDQFTCFDGTCIPKDQQCNGVKDCPEGRDEIECVLPSVENAQCGKTSTAPAFSPVFRIIGGSDSQKNTWPWQAALLYAGSRGDIFCGGSIINERYILTAAHCVTGLGRKDFQVLIGITDLEDGDNGQRLNVEQITMHDQFNGVEDGNDIAVIETTKNIEFEAQTVRPICINEAVAIKPGTACFITGWGKLTPDPGQFLFSNILQQGRVLIEEQETCQNTYGTIIDSQFCAGRPRGGVDACQGDSGGPLVCLVSGETWFQIGIVSYGVSCASSTFPGVYTNVSSFAEWINEKTGGGNPIVEHESSSCGTSVTTAASGTLTSPGYPNNYGDHLHCKTSILSATPRGAIPNEQELHIKFTDFFMDDNHGCQLDYMEIYMDGKLHNNKRYCGDDIPDDIVTTSKNCTIIFHSDHVSSERGFEMHWDRKPVQSAGSCQGEYARYLNEWRNLFQEYRDSVEEWKNQNIL